MNPDERYKITSNDYADLLINYKADETVFQNYPEGTINYIDDYFAVLHIPSEQLTVDSISKFGYPSIPCLYSLQSSPTQILSGDETQKAPNNNSLTGKGILIGVVDTGIDYLSPLFQTKENTTRILSIWDQSIPSDDKYPENFNYGTEYNSDDINLALASESPLDIVPSTDLIGHGTMITAIAASSNRPELNYVGIAPESDLVVVKLKEAKSNLKEFLCVPEQALAFQENDIMMGIVYLVRYAAMMNRPISIFVGIGTSQGDHGGRGLLSTLLSYYSIISGISIAVPAGNEGNRDHHYFGEINPLSNVQTVFLNVAPEEYGMLLELYSIPPSNLWLDIITPTNESLGRFNPTLGGGKTVQIFIQDTSVVINNFLKEDYMTLEQLIVIRFHDPLPGIWKLVLSSESDLSAQFHIWLPTEAFIQRGTYFFDANTNTTITSPGNAEKPLTVTAYSEKTNTLYYYASRGNTVLNAPKPDITAPGVDIIVPINQYYSYTSSGTSLATAYVAGNVALLLEWAFLQQNYTNFSGAEVKKIITLGGKRDPLNDYPNPEWGYGIIDIDKSIKSVQRDIGGPPLS